MRLFQTKDYQRIAMMDSQCFRPDHPVTDWEDCIWWVGVHKGSDVCYCAIKPYADDWYLSRVGVMKPWRGKGFQAKMLEKRIKAAQEGGASGIITDTMTWNIWSANNLIKKGFILFSPEYPWKGNHDDVLYWRKEL